MYFSKNLFENFKGNKAYIIITYFIFSPLTFALTLFITNYLNSHFDNLDINLSNKFSNTSNTHRLSLFYIPYAFFFTTALNYAQYLIVRLFKKINVSTFLLRRADIGYFLVSHFSLIIFIPILVFGIEANGFGLLVLPLLLLLAIFDLINNLILTVNNV